MSFWIFRLGINTRFIELYQANNEITLYNYGNKYIVKPDKTLEAFAKTRKLDGQIKDVMEMSKGIFLKIEDKTEPDFKMPQEKAIVKDEHSRGEK